MIKHLITGGCSFSSGDAWHRYLGEYFVKNNRSVEEFTCSHTGFPSQGQEMIQKKVMLAVIEALENGIAPEEIVVVVMWSGTHRKCWYIDNPEIINEMTKGWAKFVGGMSGQFLDLKNSYAESSTVFKTSSNDTFPYNLNGGWYFTVDGSDCKLGFVREHYLLDRFPGGVGKTHGSLENMIMLQNFCKLHGIALYQQYFMDTVYKDIEAHKDHQIINYLYKQLDTSNRIENGMFEYLHTLLNLDRSASINVTHQERLLLDSNTGYFSKDGFHPSWLGSKLWCDNILIPFLKERGVLHTFLI
jgi:hypothetical protein